MEPFSKHEKLPSGKTIIRLFGADGLMTEESHTYDRLEIGIRISFDGGRKTEEYYFYKQRLVGRRYYEKVRLAYPDMPSADCSIEDTSGLILRDAREERRQSKIEAERRLAHSTESRFPRPKSTNWLRVIAGEAAHLVIFASRDWKALAREPMLRTGRDWLNLFGFLGPREGSGNCVAQGLEVGFEVTGNREAMLKASESLLTEVTAFALNPPETSQWSGSIRPRPKPRKKPSLSWPTVLPPLIAFLSTIQEPTVKIFNHHR